MSKGKNSTLWRGLSSVTGSLTALLFGASAIVNANAAFINTHLGTTNYKVVDTSDGADIDSTYFKSDYESLSDLVEAKLELAEQIAEEGTVLLKNDNAALPLDISSEKVTLWGMNSSNATYGGMIGSTPTTAEGQKKLTIEQAFAEKGYDLNKDFIDFYASDAMKDYKRAGGQGIKPSFGMTYENPNMYNVGEVPAKEYKDDLLSSADDTAALVVISRGSSEAADYEPEMSGMDSDSYERPLALSQNEKDMIDLAKAHSTKVIVMLNCNNPVEIEDLKNDADIDAIVWAGEPGATGFLGTADVLAGEANPSGHLTDTYAASSISAPAMVNWGVHFYTNYSQGSNAELTDLDKGDWFLVESEGIYVGYKYYETRYEDSVLGQANADAADGATAGSSWVYEDEVTYPFGYGLSYTTFAQTLDSVECEVGGTGKATVTVENTGDVAGKSVVQLYVQAPYTEGGIEKSAIQLVAIGKTAVLDPGAKETVEIEFDPSWFASYDENAEKADGTVGAWSLEAGDYYFAIGNGAHEALNNVLAKKTGSSDKLVMTAETEVIEENNAVVWNLGETDIETYSKGVENQLQNADLNKLIEGSVEYTTRSDWTKGWTPVEDITPTEEMMVGLTNKNYELNENSDVEITWGADNGLKLIDQLILDEEGKPTGVVDWEDPSWDQLVQQVTLDEAIQFVEKGGDDTENLDSVALPRSYANDGPLGFAYDQVGGYFVRWTDDLSYMDYYTKESDECGAFSMATMPTEPLVAATFNLELVEQEGVLFGEDALWSHESSIFAPGVNLHRGVYCARNHEYYSEDSMLTSLMGVAVADGGQSKGLMIEPKHFAFNHMETNRSGLSTFFTEQSGRENELRCFQRLLSENHASGLMSAFNRVGTVYAGGCPELLTNILRNEWGYKGWIVTDMINGPEYMNWRDVVAAGGGNCLTSSAYDSSVIGTMAASKSDISKDAYFQSRMQESLKYWLYQLAGSNVQNGQTSTTERVYIMTWYQKAILGATIGFGVLTALFMLIGLLKRIKAGKKA
jgi:beta-glucosidase